MKKLTLLACLLSFGAAVPAFAEDMDMNGMMMKMNDMQMKAADANGDGTSSTAEKEAYTKKMMMMYDANKDNMMSKDEMDGMMMKEKNDDEELNQFHCQGR